MPAVKHYTVTQEREVKVSAVNEIEAARTADRAFNNSPDGTENVRSDVEVLDLTIRKD